MARRPVMPKNSLTFQALILEFTGPEPSHLNLWKISDVQVVMTSPVSARWRNRYSLGARPALVSTMAPFSSAKVRYFSVKILLPTGNVLEINEVVGGMTVNMLKEQIEVEGAIPAYVAIYFCVQSLHSTCRHEPTLIPAFFCLVLLETDYSLHLCLNVFKLLGWHWVYPFITKSYQCQISPATSAGILHHTVWRTWLFIAYLERWLCYLFSLPHLYISLRWSIECDCSTWEWKGFKNREAVAMARIIGCCVGFVFSVGFSCTCWSSLWLSLATGSASLLPRVMKSQDDPRIFSPYPRTSGYWGEDVLGSEIATAEREFTQRQAT